MQMLHEAEAMFAIKSAALHVLALGAWDFAEVTSHGESQNRGGHRPPRGRNATVQANAPHETAFEPFCRSERLFDA